MSPGFLCTTCLKVFGNKFNVSDLIFQRIEDFQGRTGLRQGEVIACGKGLEPGFDGGEGNTVRISKNLVSLPYSDRAKKWCN
jgi:hypothetical protein